MALISRIYHIKDIPAKYKKKKRIRVENPDVMDRPAIGLTGSATERMFVRRAKARGWEVLRSGWPDYMLTRKTAKGIEFQAIEVKRDRDNDELRDTQELMIAALVMQGITVGVWSADKRTLRNVTKQQATQTMNNFFMETEQLRVKSGLKSLQQLGVLVRYDA